MFKDNFEVVMLNEKYLSKCVILLSLKQSITYA